MEFFSRRFAVAMPAMPCCFSFFRCRFPDDLDERGTFQISLQRRAGQALGIMAAYCPDYDGLVIEGLTEVGPPRAGHGGMIGLPWEHQGMWPGLLWEL